MQDIIAIVGPTASGKSDLALSLANKLDGIILSVDSLSVYKEIDIASAKPSRDELASIKHFGVDLLYPNESFDVVKFLDEFQRAKEYAKQKQKKLIIVGGTSFYLKILSEGISQKPEISDEVAKKVKEAMQDKEKAYDFLENIDKAYMQNIKSNDSYRIEKALEIYYASGKTPTEYFKQNPKKPIVANLPIYEIAVDRNTLRERIAKRTAKMLEMGLIDEVVFLERKYTREPNAMKAIGIIETLSYLDGRLNKKELFEKIVTNTARLAKRQVTFNKTQLSITFSGSAKEIEERILKVNFTSSKREIGS